MTIAELNRQILAVVRDATETEMEITEHTHLIRQMGMSSVEIMMMVSELEDAFGIEIPPAALRHVQTVGDLCSLIADLLRGN